MVRAEGVRVAFEDGVGRGGAGGGGYRGSKREKARKEGLGVVAVVGTGVRREGGRF